LHEGHEVGMGLAAASLEAVFAGFVSISGGGEGGVVSGALGRT